MSYFYKYEFISPEPIYAIVKEELKSYFDTGAVDDLLFPVYTNKCLEKLGRGTHPIVPVVLFVEDFIARLPDNFYAVREAWYCAWLDYGTYTDGTAFYGNITFADDCPYYYNEDTGLYGSVTKPSTPMSGDWDSFDLHDNKFVTTFREGIVELQMYASDFDNLGNQMVPDNYRIREFIEAFIKYKVFETLTNQTNDETFNQLQQKMINYKMMADEAYIMAESEIKKQDAYTKQRRIRKSKNRFDKYELPSGRIGDYGRRRERKY